MTTKQAQSRKIIAKDVNVWAAAVVERMTGVPVPSGVVEAEIRKIAEEKVAADLAAGKNPAAVALGRLGGMKGGKARANALTPEERSEISRKGAAARWAKRKKMLKLIRDGASVGEIKKSLGLEAGAVQKHLAKTPAKLGTDRSRP